MAWLQLLSMPLAILCVTCVTFGSTPAGLGDAVRFSSGSSPASDAKTVQPVVSLAGIAQTQTPSAAAIQSVANYNATPNVFSNPVPSL